MMRQLSRYCKRLQKTGEATKQTGEIAELMGLRQRNRKRILIGSRLDTLMRFQKQKQVS